MYDDQTVKVTRYINLSTEGNPHPVSCTLPTKEKPSYVCSLFVQVIGSWADVVIMCEKGHLQPQVLFFEAAN